MNINIGDVETKFAALSGELNQWTDIVREATCDVDSRICADNLGEDDIFRLESLAAALAFYRSRLVLSARGGAESFQAGQVSIKLKDGIEAAYSLYSSALIACNGLLYDNFVFGRMESFCTEI